MQRHARSVLSLLLFFFLSLGSNAVQPSGMVFAENRLAANRVFYTEAETTSAPENQPHSAQQEHAVHEENGGHGGNMNPLLFVIIALIIGAGTRHWLRKSPLPYTVTLLLIGLLLGAAQRLGWFTSWHIGSFTFSLDFLGDVIQWAGHIDPHLILFVFLPTLIFEAAFAMDVHTFKKTFTNAFLLAVPGIITALLLTGTIVMSLKFSGIGFARWSWPLALLFGTVISATDPVAVVSLLKELGTSKKLGTLIEGESLLNDGTAIVLFMVFLVIITGSGDSASPAMEFVRVALGGTLVGLIFGWITITWVKKVLNDALIEITVIIAAAYLTFFVAESFLHVSGVLGLVALGLLMAGIGKTRISPEVEHFLHEFWELAAFIANTLIFIIVGVVIANQAKISYNNIILLLLIYVGIHIVRALVILLLYPFMRKAGYGLSPKNAMVLWWGALRGAIGLALALIVSAEQSIDQGIRDQFLFLTAGIVTMTLLINATTIRFLVGKLGLTKIAPAKALMMLSARKFLRQSSENSMNKLKRDRFLSRANWETVSKYLPEKPEIDENLELGESTIAETRRRILEKEKSSYWSQFRDGLIGAHSVRKLTDALNEIIDKGGEISLSQRKDLEQEWKTPGILGWMQSLPFNWIRKLARSVFFERLATGYDSARGFVFAQEENLKLVENMLISQSDEDGEISEHTLEIIENEINENRIHGLTFLRNLRNSYPEIYSAIATRQAIRSVLNYEKRTLDRLLNKGRIDMEEASKMHANIEVRMKKLMDSPPRFEIPKPVELLREISWLQDLKSKTFTEIVDSFQNRVYSVGDMLLREHGTAEGLFVIVRGQVKVTIDSKIIDLLGPGSVIGEMAVLTGLTRTATVTAESPVTVLWMSTHKMCQIIKKSEELEQRLWKFACTRFAENLLSREKPYTDWRQAELRQWLSQGDIVVPDEQGKISLKGKVGILLTGTAILDNKTKLAVPAVLSQKDSLVFSKDARVFVRKIN